MTFSALIHVEEKPVELDELLEHTVFSCLQWKGPNLEAMPQAYKQTFAVINSEALDDRVVEVWAKAHAMGAMSPVKLIAIHEDEIHLFLDAATSSSTMGVIEPIWAKAAADDSHLPWTMHFESETAALTGQSEYIFSCTAKAILESRVLGVERYEMSALEISPDHRFTLDEEIEMTRVAYKALMDYEPRIMTDQGIEILRFMTGHISPEVLRQYLPDRYREPVDNQATSPPHHKGQ